jgi:hypothetical protein
MNYRQEVADMLRSLEIHNRFSVRYRQNPFSGGRDVLDITIKDWDYKLDVDHNAFVSTESALKLEVAKRLHLKASLTVEGPGIVGSCCSPTGSSYIRKEG